VGQEKTDNMKWPERNRMNHLRKRTRGNASVFTIELAVGQDGIIACQGVPGTVLIAWANSRKASDGRESLGGGSYIGRDIAGKIGSKTTRNRIAAYLRAPSP